MLGWDVVRASGTAPEFAHDAVVHHRIEPRGVRGWLHVRMGMAIFPALIANIPEMRNQFFLRWFFSRRSAAFDLALVGLVAAIVLRSPLPLLALVPYLTFLAPRSHRGLRTWASRLGPYVLADCATLWTLLQGSVRYRRLLL